MRLSKSYFERWFCLEDVSRSYASVSVTVQISTTIPAGYCCAPVLCSPGVNISTLVYRYLVYLFLRWGHVRRSYFISMLALRLSSCVLLGSVMELCRRSRRQTEKNSYKSKQAFSDDKCRVSVTGKKNSQVSIHYGYVDVILTFSLHTHTHTDGWESSSAFCVLITHTLVWSYLPGNVRLCKNHTMCRDFKSSQSREEL